MAVLVGTELLNRAAQAIAAIKPCPMAGKVTADQVKLALCEWLDICPASIADDVIAHSLGDLAAALRQA